MPPVRDFVTEYFLAATQKERRPGEVADKLRALRDAAFLFPGRLGMLPAEIPWESLGPKELADWMLRCKEKMPEDVFARARSVVRGIYVLLRKRWPLGPITDRKRPERMPVEFERGFRLRDHHIICPEGKQSYPVKIGDFRPGKALPSESLAWFPREACFNCPRRKRCRAKVRGKLAPTKTLRISTRFLQLLTDEEQEWKSKSE